MPLSRDSRNLARLAAKADRGSDYTLHRLMSLAEANVRLPVTLVLDSGHMVAGGVGTEVDWGEHLDRKLDDALQEARDRAREAGDEAATERLTEWREVPE